MYSLQACQAHVQIVERTKHGGIRAGSLPSRTIHPELALPRYTSDQAIREPARESDM